ncbi:UDP-N-acetylmuramoyl-L-alanine--D-glutamate ligase [Piscinibacter sp.]|uniref:UDP-N-acetylmuramoyl-L-alanine--D-glutamate ligase n=1 Tax=Piscinibacter sp. TaxID=1903157 RepID=UPI0039E4CFE8
MKHLDDIDVLVLGLGDSGVALARWCARHGARVRAWDSRDAAPGDAALAESLPQARRLRGELGDDAFAGVKLVLKSPGLAPTDTRIAAPLARAADSGILVQGELDLFARALADLKAERGYAPRVLAVTGTNGKTTTTAMTALLVERAGRRVAMAGNIGPTMLQTLADALDAQALPEVWVLELSSFQLDEAKGFEPDAAALLNISEDHLDWHGTMAAYVAAKARVFGKDAVMVVNRDDPAIEKLVPEPIAQKGRGAKPMARRVVRFGLGEPTRPGDFGLRTENGMAWLVRATEADETLKHRKGEAEEELHIQRLMPADALRVRGRHNAANALAALALATAIGCPLAPMLHGLREYGGEPHRVEYVATVNGVDAFDDSKGTNVGATVAALDGLGADKAPARLVVILGGDGKGQDFAPLRAPLERHGRAVATIGRDAPRIEEALAGLPLPLQRHDTLEAAVRWCLARAHSGDAVLLSPACASLDMFRNYAHRAEVFVATVQSLAAERGELPA